MTRPTRLTIFAIGAACVAALFAAAFARMPAVGHRSHLYRDLAIGATAAHRTANAVSSVNFDQRGLDTLGEETILIAAVIAAVVLLQPGEGEAERRPPRSGRTVESTRLTGYLMLPVTLIIGFDVVAHGHLTPGGGFQGGVILATGVHLLYVSGSYQALERLRPLEVYDTGEALGGAFLAGIGIAGIAISGAFLANVLPKGSFGEFVSAGTVPILNAAVGVEVACAMVVLLAQFLDQEILVAPSGGGSGDGRGGGGERRSGGGGGGGGSGGGGGRVDSRNPEGHG